MTRIAKSVFFTIALIVSAATQAAPVLTYSSPGVLTAIGDLNIGGTLYNVDFGATSGFATYGGTKHFWADQTASTLAASEVVVQLDLAGVTALNNGGGASCGSPCFQVYETTTGTGSVGIYIDPWVNNGTFAQQITPIATAWSVSVIPVPAAVWLFGSALAGLGWMRRRKSV